MRLDVYLLNNNFVDSRNKAIELIKNSKIKVNGDIVKKPSLNVDNPNIEILEEILVSRAGWKLKNYIEKYNVKVEEKIAIDIGSSTGGFSEVLLKADIKEVYCVDVGSNQLHEKIRNHTKTKVFENFDIRNFETDKKFDIVVSDVSFISLNLIIKKIDELSNEDIILLFKPQFEVGKDTKRDSKGVVVDNYAIEESMRFFEENCKNLNWNLFIKEKSSITGKEGNQEWIYHFKKDN
jgi:23S rRNA (cytidine1920-2'-O)/16S rRNA (cytidine1409-2'-O)-methyltransferase